MWPKLKFPNELIKIKKGKNIFYVDPDSLFRRFKGDTKTVQFDPYAGTGTRELFTTLSNLLQGQIGQGISAYPGTAVAGISPLQQAGFDVAGGYAPVAGGGQQYFQNVLAQQQAGGGPFQQLAGQTLQGLMQPYDPAADRQYWEQAFVDPAMQTWQRDIMPMIKESYVARGAGESGALNRALGRSGEALTTDLGAQLANLLQTGRQATYGRQQQGVGQAMQMAGLPSQLISQAGGIATQGADLLGQMMNIGGQQRGISAESLQEEYSKWMQEQAYNNPWLQNYLSLALQQGASMPMQAYTQQQSPGLLSQMLPSLGGLMGSSLLSGGLGGGYGTSLGLGGPAGMGYGYAQNFGPSAYAGGGIGGLFGGIGSALGGTASGIGNLGAGILGVLSDIRLKENFDKIENALNKVLQLEGHTYNFIGENFRSAGLIAQDVEKILPEGVKKIKDIKYIRMDAILGLLVNAIKELNRKVEEMKNV